MLSCSYNGWTDLPEEEREALEAFEASLGLPLLALPKPTVLLLAPPASLPKAA